ncbi:hypothetical protein BGZ60DRAFT_216377 [Tricladium varicosporioides]|nr:hypothetical protein BGZ60DRAFT_216377 [Hymenoscyphus varicosporioides]
MSEILLYTQLFSLVLPSLSANSIICHRKISQCQVIWLVCVVMKDEIQGGFQEFALRKCCNIPRQILNFTSFRN